jgi:uncharacterized caspase-like protein
VAVGLRWLEGNAKAPDLAVVFFAGHAVRDGKEFCLLPHDADPKRPAATGITGAVLEQRLAGLPGLVLLLLDTDHAGAVGTLAAQGKVAVLGACLGKEEAGAADGHGFFSRALVEGLQGKAARNPRDSCVYLHHLEQYVIDRVAELSRDEQHPTAAKLDLPPIALTKP